MNLLLPPLLTLAFAASTLQNGPIQRGETPITTLRTSTRLVVIDVQVTDANHRPVHGLKASDFSVLEDKKTQTVKNFEEHTAATAAEVAKIPPMPKMPVGTFTNFNPAPSVIKNGPLNVLLIDRLNTPMKDQTNLRNQLTAYLKAAKPGQRMAIFNLTHQLSMLQGFSDDPEVLRMVVEKAGAKGSPLLDDANEDEMMKPNPVIKAAMERDRALRTLDALNDLARFLVGIPGRKNLIWFSGSFPLTLLPDTDPMAGNKAFGMATDFKAEFSETVSLLSQAQVAVYPVDARGVIPPAGFAAGPGAHPYSAFTLDKELTGYFDENTTMRDLAYETGGRAFINDNDLKGAVADAINDGSSYYTLTYVPSNGDWRGDYRKIEVSLREQGYELNYRQGYYADDQLAPPSSWDRLGSGRAVTGTLGPPPDFGAMHLALMHGGPEPMGIVFTVEARPANTTKEDGLAADNDGSKTAKGPYQRYELTFVANPRNFHPTNTPDGHYQSTVEFVTFVYTRDGERVNSLGNMVHIDLTKAQYADALNHNLTFHQQISVPEKGEYFLRMAMHDLQNDHVGAVEIPVSSVCDLPPDSHVAALPAIPSGAR